MKDKLLLAVCAAAAFTTAIGGVFLGTRPWWPQNAVVLAPILVGLVVIALYFAGLWLFLYYIPRHLREIRGKDDSVYLRRWEWFMRNGWSFKVHCFMRPDEHNCKHDHPWWFITLILWGGYIEHTDKGVFRRRPGMILYRPAKFRHLVAELPKGRAWTVVLTGARKRHWGFWTNAGWRYWREFVAAPASRLVLWCKED